jgi:hypothetical protein
MPHDKHEQVPIVNQRTNRVQTRPAVSPHRRQERQANIELIEEGAAGCSQIGPHVCQFLPC